ncbi:WxL protein peptidoglycan domain-containing protein [Microbacterium sp. NPDC058389]|uniref:WxL protein peptidoglycan domain-containing protein n=1 Tax=Microbacterium sp. NPDC058389 TaxID=3346475 RepID=UPI003661A9BF
MNARPASPRPRRRLSALGAAALVALALALPAAPASAATDGAAGTDDVNWTVRTESNNFGSDRTSYGYTIDPGGSVTDGIVVANHGQEPVDLKVYAADGFTSEDGALSLVVAGEESTAVGAWISADEESVTVGPGETASIPFTVSIPDDATPGDYAGGIVTSLTVPDAETGVNVDRRLGIRVDLRVGGELAPSLAVEDLSVSWNGGLNPFAGGDATVTYTLHNTGNAAIAAATAAKVGGVFGLLAVDAPAADAVPELLPGESLTQTVVVPDVPALFALIGSTTVTPLVTDAAGSRSPIAEVSASAVGLAVPWMLLIILALVAAAVVLVLRRRGRTKAEAQEREDARISEAVAQALEEERAKAPVGAAD